jgi:hypothetical protein
MSIQAGIQAGYVDIIQQDLMEIAVMQYVSEVSGRGVEGTNNQVRSPHGYITNDGTGVVCHPVLLLFISSRGRIPCQGLRGQVNPRDFVVIEVISGDIPHVKQRSHSPK